MGKYAAVLERVVAGDRSAIGLTEGTERPVVLPDRHTVEEGPQRGRVRGAGGDLVDRVPQPAQLCAETVMNIDQMPARRQFGGRVLALGVGLRAGRPGALIPRLLLAQAPAVVRGR